MRHNPHKDMAACPVPANRSQSKSVQTPEGHSGDFELVDSKEDGKSCQ